MSGEDRKERKALIVTEGDRVFCERHYQEQLDCLDFSTYSHGRAFNAVCEHCTDDDENNSEEQ